MKKLFPTIIDNIIKKRSGVDTYNNLTVKYYKVGGVAYIIFENYFTLIFKNGFTVKDAHGVKNFSLAMEFLQALEKKFS